MARTLLSTHEALKNIHEKMEEKQGGSERGRSEKQRNPAGITCVLLVRMECFKSQDVSQSSRRPGLFQMSLLCSELSMAPYSP